MWAVDYSEGVGNKGDCLGGHTDVSSVAKGTSRARCFISQVAKNTAKSFLCSQKVGEVRRGRQATALEHAECRGGQN